MTQTEYVVYRHGGNEADKRAVARVFADSPEEACRQAAGQVTVAAGQQLAAEPAAPVDEKENELNRSARGLTGETA